MTNLNWSLDGILSKIDKYIKLDQGWYDGDYGEVFNENTITKAKDLINFIYLNNEDLPENLEINVVANVFAEIQITLFNERFEIEIFLSSYPNEYIDKSYLSIGGEIQEQVKYEDFQQLKTVLLEFLKQQALKSEDHVIIEKQETEENQ